MTDDNGIDLQLFGNTEENVPRFKPRHIDFDKRTDHRTGTAQLGKHRHQKRFSRSAFAEQKPVSAPGFEQIPQFHQNRLMPLRRKVEFWVAPDLKRFSFQIPV